MAEKGILFNGRYDVGIEALSRKDGA